MNWRPKESAGPQILLSMTRLGSSGAGQYPGPVVGPAVTVDVEGVVVLAVRDHHDFQPITHRGLEVGAVVLGLVVDRHVVEDDRERLVGQDVALTAHDDRPVEPLADAARAVVRADDMVVVVPVARAARLPGAVLAAARGVGAPGVRTGAAGLHVALVHPGAVVGDVVVDAVDMEAGVDVGEVLELDVDRVALVELDEGAGDRGLALLEAVAELAVRQLLGVHLQPAHHSPGRGGAWRVLCRAGLHRPQRQRCHAGRCRGRAADQHPPAEGPSVHVELPTASKGLGVKETGGGARGLGAPRNGPHRSRGPTVYPHPGQSSCDCCHSYWRTTKRGLASCAVAVDTEVSQPTQRYRRRVDDPQSPRGAVTTKGWVTTCSAHHITGPDHDAASRRPWRPAH